MPHRPIASAVPLIRPVVAAVAVGLAAGAPAQWVTPPVVAPGVQQRLFTSAAAGTTVSYHVFTPPEYDLEPDRCFPVLYRLHGSPASPSRSVPHPLRGWPRQDV